MDRRLAAIMFADVVGYTRLVREDEPGTLSALKSQLHEIIEPKILEHKGRIVRFVGDGILVEFPSVVEATASAFELQTALAQRNATVAPSRRLVYRIGINLGDIIVDGSDLYGDGVNVAARLEAIAEPGGIAISASVYEQIKSKLPLAWESMGYLRFKNVRERICVYRLAQRDLQQTPLVEPWWQRRRLWIGGSAVAAAVGVLAFLLLGPLAEDANPLSEALPAAEFSSLLPGSEWGRYQQDGRDWVYFEYYTTHDGAKDSGEAFSYYGPCTFADSRNCLPDVDSLAVLALFGETHHWRAERFNWRLYEEDDVALHCILPDTEDEECFSYIPTVEASDDEGSRGRFLRYKVNRHNLAEHVYDGESIFYEADQWSVQDLVSGLVPEGG
jgi:class 3 adenylate cyclase